MSMPSRGLCWRSAYSCGEYKLDRNQGFKESSLTLAIRFWLILSVLDDVMTGDLNEKGEKRGRGSSQDMTEVTSLKLVEE